jgi:phosphotriesterase-related protein
LISAGINPEKIVIGHMDLAEELDYIKSVLDTGVFIAFDTIGKNNYAPDERRVDFLIELEKEGYLRQVMLSLDITRKSHFKKNGGIGYSHLFEVFLPMLRAKGMSQQAIELMLIDNPKRLFESES